MLEHIPAMFDVVLSAKIDQPAGQVIIERPGRIHHGDGHVVFRGILIRGVHRVVDADHFGHITVQHPRHVENPAPKRFVSGVGALTEAIAADPIRQSQPTGRTAGSIVRPARPR